MNEHRLPRSQTLMQLPAEWPEDVTSLIQNHLQRLNRKLVVIDDDPTGSQVVHHIPVLMKWSVESLAVELYNDLPAFFVLTNSRSFQSLTAQTINSEIGRDLAEAIRLTGRSISVVSRSDSTLRGHFPGEVQALADALKQDFNAWLIIPALPSAGRHTIEDVHYVAEQDWLIPAGESVYAQDAIFGYRSSNLKEWVEEKTSGKVSANQVRSVSLGSIRLGGPAEVTKQLLNLPHGSICIINAVTHRDLDVFTLGLLMAEEQGGHYLYRTGPTFVASRLGIRPYDNLRPQELHLPKSGGGLIVVGSYVPKTSLQINHLFEHMDIRPVEIQVEPLLNQVKRLDEIERVASQVDEELIQGRDTVLYTSRKLIIGKDAKDSRAIGQSISEGIVEAIRRIQTRPRYILAKGGITSHDLATHGLLVQRAFVLGQIITGVSVWELGPESRHEGLAFMVFPGNVGESDALTKVVTLLKPE